MFLRVQAVAGRLAQATLDVPRLFAKTASFTLRNPVAAVELGDTLLQPIDANLQAADTAVIVVVAIAMSGPCGAG